jgi:ABC-type bacteriocin/lantibiotic exporter with double-glycine peptidase domain
MRAAFATSLILLLVSLGTSGCASYRGSARNVSQPEVAAEPGWTRIEGVALVRQKGIRDCGAAALSMVLAYWEERTRHASKARADIERAEIDRALRHEPGEGLSAGGLRDYARRRGHSAFVFQGSIADLKHELGAGRPVIVGVHKPLSSGEALAHYEVLIGIHPERKRVLTLDPARGLRENDIRGFAAEWESAGRVTLVILPRESTETEAAPAPPRAAL